MSYKVLIVEDSPELLEIMCDFYREEGAGLWEVDTASNGNDAMAKVSEESYDLMILDIMLPGVSGFDICREARNKSDCPIIFVTALSTEDFILKGYESQIQSVSVFIHGQYGASAKSAFPYFFNPVGNTDLF